LLLFRQIGLSTSGEIQICFSPSPAPFLLGLVRFQFPVLSFSSFFFFLSENFLQKIDDRGLFKQDESSRYLPTRLRFERNTKNDEKMRNKNFDVSLGLPSLDCM